MKLSFSILQNDQNRKFIKLGLLFFCFFFILWRIIFVPLYESEGARNPIRGDGYSDKNVHSTAMYMYDFGFTKSYLLPVFGYKGDLDTSNVGAYTHYPCIPDLLGGVYAKLLDTKSVQTIRIFPMLISLFFFYFIFYFLKKIILEDRQAFISAAIIVLSNYFLAFGDSLHKHLYEELLKWLFIFVLYSYYTFGKSPIKLIGLFTIAILEANISFEPITYIAVSTVGFSWVFEKKVFSLENFIIGLAVVSGFGLHMYQNYLYMGDWTSVYLDMKGAATMRTSGVGENSETAPLTFSNYLEIPLLWINRLERSFLFPGWALVFPIYLLVKKWKNEGNKLLQICIVLFFASISWSLVMNQHFYVHGFTIRHFGILYALLVGPAIVVYFDFLKDRFKNMSFMLKFLNVGIITYALIMMCINQVFELYIKYGFAYPYFGK